MPPVRTTKHDPNVNKLLNDASTVIKNYSVVDHIDASSRLKEVLRQIQTVKGHLDFVIAHPYDEHLENRNLMGTIEEIMKKYYPLDSIGASIKRECNALKPHNMRKATNNVLIRVLSRDLKYLVGKYETDRIPGAYTEQEMDDLRDKFRRAMPWLYRQK